MKLSSLALGLFSLALGLLLFSCSLPDGNATPIDVYLGPLGQSNAVGKFGPVPNRLIPAQQHEFSYWIDGGAGNLSIDSRQLSPTYGYGAVFGAELSFGESFANKIAIIKVAKSGSPIAEWAREETMYSQLQTTVAASLADLVAQGFEPTIRGAMWVQGEYDSGSAATASVYEAKLTQLITDLRLDYGQDLRFVYNQLHYSLPEHWPSMQWVGDIRQAQLNVANSIPNVRLINADDLQIDTRDYLHFSPSMQDMLGQRMAKSFLSPGDLNYDGTVNGEDFLSWQRGYHIANELQEWKSTYNTTATLHNIPEPSSVVLLVVALLGLITLRRN